MYISVIGAIIRFQQKLKMCIRDSTYTMMSLVQIAICETFIIISNKKVTIQCSSPTFAFEHFVFFFALSLIHI